MKISVFSMELWRLPTSRKAMEVGELALTDEEVTRDTRKLGLKIRLKANEECMIINAKYLRHN